jgi:hypothetical protein
MNLFSELYSCYYSVTSKILKDSPLSEKQINELINTNAFSESALYLLPKLCHKNGWNLLSKTDNNFSTSISTIACLPLTTLEKRWIKALLLDPRIHLFITATVFEELIVKLADIEPLYKSAHFKWFDMFTDGDDYADPNYIKNFQKILKAIKAKTIINVMFKSGKGKTICGSYLPYKLEYSKKNNRFRIYVAKMVALQSVSLGTINLSRIHAIQISPVTYPAPIDMNKIFQWKRCIEPVTLEITNERNGIERFMMEFASYEKQTVIDDDNRKCTANLWYDLQDETELVIKLLSFGPVLQVTSPSRVITQLKDRVERQYNLLFEHTQ